jgi:hypothetical protein
MIASNCPGHHLDMFYLFDLQNCQMPQGLKFLAMFYRLSSSLS